MTEPTYLPLLNSIAVNEAKGEILASPKNRYQPLG